MSFVRARNRLQIASSMANLYFGTFGLYFGTYGHLSRLCFFDLSKQTTCFFALCVSSHYENSLVVWWVYDWWQMWYDFQFNPSNEFYTCSVRYSTFKIMKFEPKINKSFKRVPEKLADGQFPAFTKSPPTQIHWYFSNLPFLVKYFFSELSKWRVVRRPHVVDRFGTVLSDRGFLMIFKSFPETEWIKWSSWYLASLLAFIVALCIFLY